MGILFKNGFKLKKKKEIIVFDIRWTSESGAVTSLCKMNSVHLDNLHKWLLNHGPNRYHFTAKIVEAEKFRRVRGVYPDDYNQIIIFFISAKETNRLQVFANI